ncbi:MAG: hypothetical protein A2X97_03365 [Bdellovibrionales bacterium GWA1_52_35]|nr:MAG: hypothetical protein A2X97_03365 [Bdellovibrionales bacterium GWA1_52_35]
MASFETYFQLLQKAFNPAIWSKGITQARDLAIVEDKLSADEMIFRVLIPNRPVSPRVTLWPEDEDWHCNCGDRNDPCSHIAAVAIAYKAGTIRKAGSINESSVTKPSAAATIQYRFSKKNQRLQLERWISGPGDKTELLRQSLVAYIGGLGSGRIAAASVAATREDFGVDALLNDQRGSELDGIPALPLLKALSSCANLTLDGEPVSTSSTGLGCLLRVSDDAQGFRLQLFESQVTDEVFENGFARRGNILIGRIPNGLSAEELKQLSPPGMLIPAHEAASLVSEILPVLSAKISIQNESNRLPTLVTVSPRVVLETTAFNGNQLSILPVVIYGNPAIARLESERLVSLSQKEAPKRDLAAERVLIRRLKMELHLQPDQPLLLEGEAAIRFVNETRGWNFSGKALEAFRPTLTLTANLAVNPSGFEVQFSSGAHQADAQKVFAAWRAGTSHVQLMSGDWARLPKDWLERYGNEISGLLAARNAAGALPTYRRPELAELCEKLEVDCPSPLVRLRSTLADFSRIPEAPLPENLKADLRNYQKTGFNWLEFLREHQLGAMLADDMGLGKTLQALCTLRTAEKTLIVVPRSVLGSWADQLSKFRPDLTFGIFHGNARQLPQNAAVVITTYAILRIEQELLAAVNWDTIILDEAQTIRNPESQITRAAHRLQGSFRIALSGTPIENKLEDLWSQFQFLNPGLLGSRQFFLDQFETTQPEQQRSQSLLRLNRTVRPFLLRRLKKEVAAELPERIETVLNCTLSAEERSTYESILATSREEVLKQLAPAGGGNMLGILEILLRLRQACCHRGLVPGQEAPSSSKLELLLETLDTSLQEGHRSLIFSQWTSLLDLIEPHLKSRKIGFLRIDGATQKREEIVKTFQSEQGPPILLMSLKAGGVGLTLTAADHVFLLDPWWNPAAENQAADRAHRIGQTRSVMIHRLIAENTIEERILELQQHKTNLADSILKGGALSSALTREDLLALLAP